MRALHALTAVENYVGLFGNAMNLALHRHCSNDDDDLTYYSSAIECHNITVLTKKRSKITVLNTGN